MKIKGKDRMEWLHQVHKESQQQRKSSRRTLARHLKTLEGKRTLTGMRASENSGSNQKEGQEQIRSAGQTAVQRAAY